MVEYGGRAGGGVWEKKSKQHIKQDNGARKQNSVF
jgi:hypothetical protein